MKPEMKNIGKEETGVSPVIAVILMVAITVVLAAVLFAWSQQLAGNAGGTIGTASIQDEYQASGADWNIKVLGGGPYNLAGMELQVKSSGIPVVNARFDTSTTADHIIVLAHASDTGQTTTSGYTNLNLQTRVYIMPSQAGAIRFDTTSVFMNANYTAGTNAAALSSGITTKVSSMTNTTAVLFDNNKDGKFGDGDHIRLYDDNNGDGTRDVDIGMNVNILINGEKIDEDGLDL